MKENIVAVCISGKQEAWGIPEIPFYCHAEGFKEFPHYPPVKTRERIQYLAMRRNMAHKQALERNPHAEHFLSIDSYYLTGMKAYLKVGRRFVAVVVSPYTLDGSGNAKDTVCRNPFLKLETRSTISACVQEFPAT